jgi:uncharacterized protein (TIGR00369 family)
MELLQRWIACRQPGGFNELLRTQPVLAEPGAVEVECALDECHGNLSGILHGGVTAALADVAAGAAVMTLLEPGETLLTADLQLRYLKPSQLKGNLLARAEVTHRDGRRVIVAIRINAGSDVVAHATASIVIRSPVLQGL